MRMRELAGNSLCANLEECVLADEVGGCIEIDEPSRPTSKGFVRRSMSER